MAYTKLEPQQARKISSINSQMCNLREAMNNLAEVAEDISVNIGELSAEEQALLANILLESTTISGNTAQRQRTPNYIRATTAGTISAVTYDVSIANVGTSDGTVLGTSIGPGEILNFNAGSLNNTYASNVFTYDATGTELMIIYNT